MRIDVFKHVELASKNSHSILDTYKTFKQPWTL